MGRHLEWWDEGLKKMAENQVKGRCTVAPCHARRETNRWLLLPPGLLGLGQRLSVLGFQIWDETCVTVWMLVWEGIGHSNLMVVGSYLLGNQQFLNNYGGRVEKKKWSSPRKLRHTDDILFCWGYILYSLSSFCGPLSSMQGLFYTVTYRQISTITTDCTWQSAVSFGGSCT